LAQLALNALWTPLFFGLHIAFQTQYLRPSVCLSSHQESAQKSHGQSKQAKAHPAEPEPLGISYLRGFDSLRPLH